MTGVSEGDEPSPPKGKLTTGSIRGHVVKLTVPMVWGIVAVISKSIVDTYFVAQLGTASLSALGFCFPVMMVVQNLAIGLGAGTSAVVARNIGEGAFAKVRHRTTHGLMLAVILVTVTAALGLLTVDPLFTLLGAEGEVLSEVRAYMVVWYLGIGFLVVPMVGNGVIRANGDAKIPGLIMIGSAVTNAALDPILIFGYLGAPALGIRGAALATLISNVLSFAGSVALLHFRERFIDWSWPKWEDVARSWRAILHIGAPASATNMINPLGIGIVTGILGRLGPEVVAGFGVATRIEGLAIVVLLALSATIGPVVGQNFGAGAHRRVKTAIRFAYQICLGWAALLAVILFFAGGLLAGVFDETAAVREVAEAYLTWVPISLAGYGVGIVTAASFNALGRPFRATLLTIVRILLVYVPVTWVATRFMGWSGILVGATSANAMVGVAAYALYRRALPIRTDGQSG